MTAPAKPSNLARSSRAGRAFGLTIHSEFQIPGVVALERQTTLHGAPVRRLSVSLSESPAGPEWGDGATERTVEMLGANSTPLFTIDHHPTAGYKVWIDGLGSFLIDPHGRDLVYRPVATGDLRYRLLVGQGLPIAAALQGLEVLHASAVVLQGRALAFAAQSGTGKTALALALMQQGADFLADDVIAVESVDDHAVFVHPGVAAGHVHANDLSTVDDPAVGIDLDRNSSDKRHIGLPVHPAGAPMGALYFIDRGPQFSRTHIARMEPDPRLLLGATFVAHVPTDSRLIKQLDICARLAQSVPIFLIQTPLVGRATEIAEQIMTHGAA